MAPCYIFLKKDLFFLLSAICFFYFFNFFAIGEDRVARVKQHGKQRLWLVDTHLMQV